MLGGFATNTFPNLQFRDRIKVPIASELFPSVPLRLSSQLTLAARMLHNDLFVIDVFRVLYVVCLVPFSVSRVSTFRAGNRLRDAVVLARLDTWYVQALYWVVLSTPCNFTS